MASHIKRNIENGYYDKISMLLEEIKAQTLEAKNEIDSEVDLISFIPEEYKKEYVNDDFFKQMTVWESTKQPFNYYFDSEEEFYRLHEEWRLKWVKVSYLLIPKLVNRSMIKKNSIRPKGRTFSYEMYLEKCLRKRIMGNIKRK